MKKYIQSFFIIASILFAFTNSVIAQETINLTLIVDTDKVSTQETYTFCYFNGQSEFVDSREFTTNATVGDIIVWNAVSSSSEKDQVKITAITYEKGTNIFSTNKISGQNGVVTATANTSTEGKQDYKYTISFKIIKNGKFQPGTFHIDPKIKVAL